MHNSVQQTADRTSNLRVQKRNQTVLMPIITFTILGSAWRHTTWLPTVVATIV